MGIRDGLLLADYVFRARQREQEEFDLKKQDLALRRDVLKGQEASRQLQDDQLRLNLRKFLEDYGRQQEAARLLSDAEGGPDLPAAPAPTALGAPPPVSDLAPELAPPASGPRQPGNPAAMYHRLIAQIGQHEGMAEQVIQHAQALIQPESNYNADAVSPKGATGVMQLMPATQARYGVEDPLNPLENLRGGLRYLQDLYQRFPGDQTW